MALSVRAAGGVPRRLGHSGAEVLLVHRPRYDDWTLPKGKATPGETDEQTALREVEEETGLRCALGRELPSTQYRDSRERSKVVRYWTMVVRSGAFRPHDEVDEIAWLPREPAAATLSYQRDVEVVAAAPDPLMVFRHASAGDRADWDGADASRPLDARGRRQAEALVDQLRPYTVNRIVSSPFDRCIESVVPLAWARGLEVEPRDELAEGADPAGVRRLLLQLDAEAVACMHGPELTPLFGKVKKGSTVAVDVAREELLELDRLPPPA